jgi:hypothetical protein
MLAINIFMNNKRKVFILFLVVLIITAFVFVVFLKFNKKEEIRKTVINNLQENIEQLKKMHPEFTNEQIGFFSDVAAKKTIQPCISRQDENDCIFSAAFINMVFMYCSEIKDEKARLKCSHIILVRTAKDELSKCNSIINDDQKIQCITKIFYINKEQTDCEYFEDLDVRKECESVVNYNKSLTQSEPSSCEKIQDENLKNYCLKIFKNKKSRDEINSNLISTNTDMILKSRNNTNTATNSLGSIEINKDTDNDGLTDQEEVNKYLTDPNNSDTDGDGYKDGDEVKNGHNPIGND